MTSMNAGTLPARHTGRVWRYPIATNGNWGRNRLLMRGAAEPRGGDARVRKNFALFLIALMALTLVFAAVGPFDFRRLVCHSSTRTIEAHPCSNALWFVATGAG